MSAIFLNPVAMDAPLYTVAALDTALRAQQIQSDQSLAAAWPSLEAPFSIGGNATMMTISAPTYAGKDGHTGPITAVYRSPDRPGEYEVGP